MSEEELNKLGKVVPLGIISSLLIIDFNKKELLQAPSRTVSYVIQNAESNWEFGATGHVSSGLEYNGLIPQNIQVRVYKSKVTGIDKEKEQLITESPNFQPDTPYIGRLQACSKFGDFGDIIDTSIISKKSMSIGIPTTGNAKLLTTIDDNGAKKYDIIISKVDYKTLYIFFDFADEKLNRILGKRGVSGMSGSPIIQNR